MLDRIQAQAVDPGLRDIPQKPFPDFLAHLRIVHVHIHAHQVIEIAVFGIRILLPLLAGKSVDQALVPFVLIVIRTGKMSVVPDEITVFSISARKGEFRPDPDRVLALHLLHPVVPGIGHGHDLLRFIRAHSVIEDDIGKDADPVIVKGPDRLQIFLFGPVLGADSPLLIKFTQIVKVIYAVADILLTGSLIGRRKPDICDPDFIEVLRLRRAPFPPEPVVGQIPLKILHHGFVD